MGKARPVAKVFLVGLLLYSLLWQGYWPGPRPAEAAFFGGTIVFDPTVAFRILQQIAETAELVQQGIANLLSFTNMGLISAVIGHVQAMMETMQDIMDDIAAISRDWNALTESDQLPTTAVQLFEWNARASGLMLIATRKAYVAMSLLQGVIHLLRDAQRLFALIMSLAGNLQSMQMIATQMTTLVNETIRAETMVAAYHQAMLAPVIVQAVNEQVGAELSRKRLEGYGTVGPHLDLR